MSSEPSRPQDKVLILKRVPVFASCTDEQLHLIADRTRLVEFKKGETIYREGDPANAFYIISSGRLRVFTANGPDEKTLTVLHNGDSFGEISLLTGETHSATVQALNDTLILELQKGDFDDVINRIPSLVLYLSRQLSKRLRTRQLTSEFSEATIAAMYSATTGVGQTCVAIALAASLKRETGKEVVLVDFRGGHTHRAWLYPEDAAGTTSQHVLLGASSDEPFNAEISTHPLGFNMLAAASLFAEDGGEQIIAPLLSFLTNRFAYVLIELPPVLEPGVIKALVQSDLIYLVSDHDEAHVLRTNALIRQLQEIVGTIDQRLKIIVNLLPGVERPMATAEIAQQLGRPVAHVLPCILSPSGQLTLEALTQTLITRSAPYTIMARYMARELSGLLVGLALGSGAALGLAHIGVLKVLEREQIPIDIVAGSSIGALVGGLWASGRSATELEEMALRFKNPWDVRKLFMLDLGIPWISLMIGIAAGVGMGWLAGVWTGLLCGFLVCMTVGLILGPLVGGPIEGARLMAQLEQDFAGKTFDQTWIPLKVVAANPMTREEVVFESGRLADAVRASVSIPGIFKPVLRGGNLCLDGGVLSPVPVGVLKRAGANRVIAVNVFPNATELASYRQERQRRRAERDAQLASRSLPIRVLWRIRQEVIRSMSPLVFDVIMRSMQAMEHQIADVACRESDLTLRPTVPGSHWLEFFNPEKFIRRGEEITLQYLPELKRITRRGV